MAFTMTRNNDLRKMMKLSREIAQLTTHLDYNKGLTTPEADMILKASTIIRDVLDGKRPNSMEWRKFLRF